jgi:pimeloyl-ACP methyl ester carboxylesterase
MGALLAAGLLAGVVSSCGSSTSTPSTTATSATAARGDFAGLVDLGGGRKVYLECHGSGSPTVILQSGYGDAASIWHAAKAHPPAVEPGVAVFTKVCAYDRPGSLRNVADTGSELPSNLPSRSQPVSMPRTGVDVVSELHTLLTAAKVPGPYVMVGHSLGGLFSVLYARTYPDQVSGIVLVDPFVTPLKQLLPPQTWDHVYVEPLLHPRASIPGYQQEAYDPDGLVNQVGAAPPLRPMPVTVLVHGKPETEAPGVTSTDLDAVNRISPQAEAVFAASVPGARLVTVPDTTHYIQIERPDVVIDTIRQVISQGAHSAK